MTIQDARVALRPVAIAAAFVSVEAFERNLQPALRPEQVADAVVALERRGPSDPQELLVSGDGVAGVR